MTYKELQIGQKIKIGEREPDDGTGRTRIIKKQYIITAKYPHMCIAEDRRGSRRGLSLGDLIMNGIIVQKAELEAVKKEPSEKTYKRKGR